MADRRVRVILEAQAANFQRGMDQAKKSLDGFKRSTDDMSKQDALRHLAPGFVAFGTAVVGALGMATKAAIDWESSWTNVMRRVEGTPQQLEALEDGLRSLARSLPSTHDEVAQVAAAAAQLGVATGDIEEFTEVMIAMGVATDMTAEQAATSMQRFSNIMGTPVSEIENLGSAVVDLGNNSATTESEIMGMATRLAGAGNLFGMSEGEVLGMAAAMSSVGIEAQAGGTAMSQTMRQIGSDVDDGGERLEEFARISGMSAEEFSTLWREDAASALTAFVVGLEDAEGRGESLNGILDELGITGIRQSDVLLRLASNSELFADSLQMGNEAFGEGTALMKEAETQYDTVSAKITQAWGSIVDAAITAGEVMLPVIGFMADGVSDLANWFADLPEPVAQATVILGGLAGAASLAGGSLLLMAPHLMETVRALQAIGVDGPKAVSAIKGLGTAAGVAAIALGGLLVVMEINDRFRETGRSAEELEHELNRLALEGGHAGDAFRDLEFRLGGGVNMAFNNTRHEVSGLEEAMVALDSHDQFFAWVPERLQPNDIRTFREEVEGTDQAFQGMVSGGSVDQAIEQMGQIAGESLEAGRSLEELRGYFPGYVSALDEMAVASGFALDETELLKWAFEGIVPESIEAAGGVESLGQNADHAGDQMSDAADGGAELEAALDEVGLSADGAVESLSDFLDILFETGILAMDAREAQARYEQAIRDVDSATEDIIETMTREFEQQGMTTEAARAAAEEQWNLGVALNDTATDFDLTTEAGMMAQDAFHTVADRGRDAAKAMSENGASQDEVQDKLKRTYDDLIDAAVGFGISEDAAAELTREVLGIPEGVDIESWMSREAEQVAQDTKNAIDEIDGRHSSSSHTHTVSTEYVTTGTPQTSSGIVMNQSAGGHTFSRGGAVRGPGSGTSDDIPSLLSDGEHVLTAAEVRAMGGQQAVYQFRASLTGSPTSSLTRSDLTPAYASGGAVSAAAGGGGAPLVGSIYASGPSVTDVVNQAGDLIFRRLKQEGVPVGNFR